MTVRPLCSPSLRRKLAGGLALLFTLGLVTGAPVYGRARRIHRQALTSRLMLLKRRQQNTRAQLRETKGQQQDVVEELHGIQNALLETAARIDLTEDRLKRVQSELKQTQDRLAEAREQWREDRGRLSRRMVAARQSGGCGYLSVALGAKDFRDLLDREHFLSKVVESDVTLIRAVQRRMNEIKVEEANLARQQAVQRQLVADLAEQRESQRAEYAQQKAVYERLRQERAALEAALEQEEKDSDRVREMLEGLARTPEGHARAAVAWTGSFVRPVNGPMTSGFGRRYHPVLHVMKLHTGVDFGVPPGTPVHAAADGVVVHAGWLGAYGNAVIIDHGGGISTLYGHNSYVDVRVGQSVKAGDLISHSGSTGYSTGPHVHFEKRVNGNPVAPF